MNLRRRISDFIRTFNHRFDYAPERRLIRRVFADEADANEVNACLDRLEHSGLYLPPGAERPNRRIPVRGFRAPDSQPAGTSLEFGSLVIDLKGVGVSAPEEVYAIQAPDDSMLGAGVRRGDFALIAGQAGPCSGDITVVRQEGRLALRRYVLIVGIPHLLAEHPIRPELTPAYEAQFEGVLWAVLQIDPSHRRINRLETSRASYSERLESMYSALARPAPERAGQPRYRYPLPEFETPVIGSRARQKRSAGKAKNLYQKASLVDPGQGLPKYGVNEGSNVLFRAEKCQILPGD